MPTNTKYYSKVLIVDVETTGLLPKKKDIISLDKYPHILQLSFILYDITKNKIQEKYNAYIKVDEDVEISAKITEITGITREICDSKGVPITEALAALYDAYIMSDSIVAHNMDFDSKMISIECLRNSELLSDQFPLITKMFDKNYNMFYCIDVECTMRMSVDLCNIHIPSAYGGSYKKFPTLAELYRKLFGEVPGNLHNSMMDVLVCLRCYLKMRHMQHIRPVIYERLVEDVLAM